MLVVPKFVPLRGAICFTLLFGSSVCFAQTAEPGARTNGDDLKMIRASLEKLVKLTEELNNTQRAILAMQEMQLYEFRMQALETRHDALMDQESKLSALTPSLERAAKDTESGIGPTGLAGTSSPPDSGIRRETAEQLDANLRALDSVRAKTQQIENEIAGLRARMENLHKALVAAGIEQ
jgi:hypothetical protein